MPLRCEDLCEMEATGSTFGGASGHVFELYECRICGHGEDRMVYDDEDWDDGWDPTEYR